MRISRPGLGGRTAASWLAVPVLLFGASLALPPAMAAGVGSVSRSDGLPASEAGNATTIGVGRLPSSVAADPVSGTVWVVNSGDNTVSEVSEARHSVVATIKVGVSPVDVAVDQKTATVWVTCLGPFGDPSADNTVSEISEVSRKVVATIKVGVAPFGLAADPRTGTVWVANTGSHTVSEINEARRAVVATIHTGPGAAPDSVAVDPVRGVVWVARLGITVEKISEASRSVIATVKVRPGAGPGTLNAVAVDAGTGAAWVASDFYDDGSYLSYASAVTPAARQVTGGVLVTKPGWYSNIADGIAADPSTGTVWVAEDGANTVTLISAGIHGVARNLATGDEPVAVAVDGHTRTVWVVSNYDGTLTSYAYASPQFTSPAQVTLTSGRRATVRVHTRGFPIAVMSVQGALPRGMRARLGQGAVVITGRPAHATRSHTFRITVSADNGIGTAGDQYVFTQQLVIRVT